MEQQGQGKREIPEKTPTTSGLIRHDPHVRKSGSVCSGNRSMWEGVSSIVVRLSASQLGELGSTPGSAAGRRAFSGLSAIPRPYILALLHTHLASTSSAQIRPNFFTPHTRGENRGKKITGTLRQIRSERRGIKLANIVTSAVDQMCSVADEPTKEQRGAVLPTKRSVLNWESTHLQAKIPISFHSSLQPFPSKVVGAVVLLEGYPFGVVVRLIASRLGEPGSSPGGVSSVFSHAGMVPEYAASLRIFSWVSRLPHPFNLALLHTHLASPSSALKTSISSQVKGFPVTKKRFRRLLTSRSWESRRVIEVCMGGRGRVGDPWEGLPTSGIVRYGSQMRESGVARPGIEPESPWWEASRLIAQPPRPPSKPVSRIHILVDSCYVRSGFVIGLTHPDPPLTTGRPAHCPVAGRPRDD
ncbi:hypothetical protein PR048_021152 [Dryococelus australis]|uniref:Uncharacterized protein n=1 Tax=Dryococelus australis TaxID=614101 RepID=A0ABQ9GXE5_9NEOP|nr:hypothetical protein PR048_021152 [Dryococelus australis]